jgi:hypothetical protein
LAVEPVAAEVDAVLAGVEGLEFVDGTGVDNRPLVFGEVRCVCQAGVVVVGHASDILL